MKCFQASWTAYADLDASTNDELDLSPPGTPTNSDPRGHRGHGSSHALNSLSLAEAALADLALKGGLPESDLNKFKMMRQQISSKICERSFSQESTTSSSSNGNFLLCKLWLEVSNFLP